MVGNQIQLFFIFIINGLLIGLLFDFFRILRKAIKTSDFITYIEDILFWIFTGLIILYSIFTYNNGEIRLFMFIAILVGIIIYMALISKFIISANMLIINTVKKIFSTIFKIIKIPLNLINKLMRRLFLKPISFVIINIRNYFTKIFKKFDNLLKKAKLSNKFVKNTKN